MTFIASIKKYWCVSIKYEMCYKFVTNDKFMKYMYMIYSFEN